MSITTIPDLLKQHATITIGDTTANWNSGTATSGSSGADLFTMGQAGKWSRINFGAVILTGLDVAATITIREYMDVAGSNRMIMEDDWLVTEELALLSWLWDSEIYGLYRIELYSDQAADDGVAIDWEYRIKDW